MLYNQLMFGVVDSGVKWAGTRRYGVPADAISVPADSASVPL